MSKPILLAGDIHSNEGWLRNALVPEALANGCDRIIALGDFGMFWSGISKALRSADYCAENGIELWFLDGNHENFDLMEDYGFFTDGAEPTTNSKLPNLTYLPRGSTFEWDGKTIMAFGGAVSIDKGRRVPGVSWWPQELITEEQVRRVEDNPTKVDILLSHDVPATPPILDAYLNDPGWGGIPYKLDQLSKGSRVFMRRVFDAVKPSEVYHGHYHYPYKDRLDLCDFTGLGCDGMRQSAAILVPTNDNATENPE